MAPQKLTEYERKRLENIRRNDEMVAALKLHSKAFQLSKRPRVGTKSHNVAKSEKKPKTETPVVIRRSLRARGIPPDSTVDAADSNTLTHKSPTKTQPVVDTSGPIPMKDAYRGTDSDRSFLESLTGSVASKEEAPHQLEGGSFKLESLSLDPKNIERLLHGRITHVRFFPSSNLQMIVAGNKYGDIGFWNVGESAVFSYHPHQAPISGILVQPHCLSKVYTSCYDGLVRLMDAEKEIFDMVYTSDECIFALSQPKNEPNCLYFGEGLGNLTVWDNRIGQCSSCWALHETRINTIDFNPEDPHIVATSSSDATACTWDLRYTGGRKLTPLRTFTHKRSVQSAYFSPSGCSLATTSMDNTIGIYSGVNLEDATSVYHDNQTSRWISTFRAIWGWDESYLFIGNMGRGVDIVSAVHRATVMTLQGPSISAIPCRFDAHPSEVGMLAGATGGGQVYIWTSS